MLERMIQKEMPTGFDFGLDETDDVGDNAMDTADNQPITILKDQNCQESYALFCLGEVLNDNFIKQAEQNLTNAEQLGHYNRFKTALMNINVNIMQSLEYQNKSNNQKYIEMLEGADEITLTLGNNQPYIFCEDICEDVILFKKHGTNSDGNAGLICRNYMFGFFMVKTMQKQITDIATNFTIKLPTNRPKNMMEDLIAILHQTNYKKEVRYSQYLFIKI